MLDLHLQHIIEKFVRISLLQNFFVMENGSQVRRFRKIGEVQGVVIDGIININSNSAIRRDCSIDMVITDSSFLVSEDSKIWMDKWFKVEVGIKSLKDGDIKWFNKGIYAINNPAIRYSATEKKLHIEGLDLMCTLDGTLGGTLGIKTKISKEDGIANTLKTAVCKLGKISENQIYIEQNNLEIPQDIEKTPSDTIYSILEHIKELYMDWEIFFDENGRFIYQKIKNRYVANPIPNFENDMVAFSFLKDNSLIRDYNLDYDFKNIKNKIIVWGKMRDDGVQVKYEITNTDENSPFNVNKIGTIPFALVDEKIFNTEQAEQRARYEYWKHNNFNEKVTVNLVPLYFLDVNTLIEFNEPDINLNGKFLIDSISLPLSHDGLMSLSAHKVYAIE